jgi:hypothetical protein
MTPGQAAYEELRRQINDSTPIHPWDRLTDKGKAGWERIAEAAIEVYEDPEGLGPIARDMDPEELARFRAQACPTCGGCCLLHDPNHHFGAPFTCREHPKNPSDEELARFRMSQLPDFNGTLKGVRE